MRISRILLSALTLLFILIPRDSQSLMFLPHPDVGLVAMLPVEDFQPGTFTDWVSPPDVFPPIYIDASEGTVEKFSHLNDFRYNFPEDGSSPTVDIFSQWPHFTVKVTLLTIELDARAKCHYRGQTWTIFPNDLGQGPDFATIVTSGSMDFNDMSLIQCWLSVGKKAQLAIFNIGILYSSFLPTAAELHPANRTRDQDVICNASSINVDSLSLEEELALVGQPFRLAYQSDRYRASSRFSPKTLGLGGWVPSVLHFYSAAESVLYLGHGPKRSVESRSSPRGRYVASEDGSEIYIFDNNGRHVSTLDAMTGSRLYSFEYDSLGRLLVLNDRFGNTTTFERGSGEVVVTSAFGRKTRLVLDGNGHLAQVIDPGGRTHRLTHSTEGRLLSLKKPMGQLSEFTYDASGFLVRDVGAGGTAIDLTREIDVGGLSQTVTSSTVLGRKTIYQAYLRSSGAAR